MFVCREDVSCSKKYESKKSLKRHMRYMHPTSRPVPPILKVVNGRDKIRTTVTAMDVQEKMFVCREGDTCSKKYRSRRSLTRHVRWKHQTRQPAASIQQTGQPAASIPPALLTPTMASTPSYEAITPTSTSKRVGHDIVDRDPDSDSEKEDALKRSDVVDNEHMNSGDVRDQNRNSSIVKDFLTYWDDRMVETRTLDMIALYLIKHSRIATKEDVNYMSAIGVTFDAIYKAGNLDRETLFKISIDFIDKLKRYNGTHYYFDWDCLVIVFTTFHDLLMRYPHLYPDIVSAMLEVFNIAGHDLARLGGWKNFIQYSKKFHAYL